MRTLVKTLRFLSEMAVSPAAQRPRPVYRFRPRPEGGGVNGAIDTSALPTIIMV